MDRNEALREFKSRKTPRGVFAVRCKPAIQVWVDSSPNLDGAQNGIWFQLRMGNHSNKPLQAAWNEYGERAFQFEILERLDDDVEPTGLKDLLAERKRHWAATLASPTVYP